MIRIYFHHAMREGGSGAGRLLLVGKGGEARREKEGEGSKKIEEKIDE